MFDRFPPKEEPTLIHLNVDGTAEEARELAEDLNGKLTDYEVIVTDERIESSFYNGKQMVEEIAERVVEKIEE